ncbi:MAG: endonuclease III [Planctomycetota bacterium]|jgi:endonuclease-3
MAAPKRAARATGQPRQAPVETGESLARRRARAKKILAKLKQAYGPVNCALNHSSALELLVATILSAQSTDENVNRTTPGLFAKYRSAAAYAAAATEELENEVHSTGFFRQKTKSIQGACRLIVERFAGQVPETMEELLELPGVARKTANVLLGTWFGQNDGVVVDTHVGRLAQRTGLTWRAKNDKDAVKIESDLMELLPRGAWTYFSHAIIKHGRTVCTARKPDCRSCKLARLCPSADSNCAPG